MDINLSSEEIKELKELKDILRDEKMPKGALAAVKIFMAGFTAGAEYERKAI